MVQILEGMPSFGQSIGSALGGGLGAGINQGVQFAQQMMLQEAKQKKEDTMAKQMAAQNALGTLDALESLIDQPGIGMMGSLNPSNDARRNRGEFEATTAALLPMFKQMFPRGFTEREFKVIRENYIPSASDTEDTIRGKITGLKHLINQMSEGKSFDEARKKDLTSGGTDKSSSTSVKIKNKKTGKIYNIPEDEVENALASGGELI